MKTLIFGIWLAASVEVASGQTSYSSWEKMGFVPGSPKEAPSAKPKQKTTAKSQQEAVDDKTKETIRKGMQDRAMDAYYLGRRAVERSLKAPSTAKFSNPLNDNGTGTSPYGFYQWKVFGWVEAQNSFGARIRSDWMAVVKQSGEVMRVSYFRVGDQEVGEMPGIALAPPLARSITNNVAGRSQEKQPGKALE